jgi:hypothetical protein
LGVSEVMYERTNKSIQMENMREKIKSENKKSDAWCAAIEMLENIREKIYQ